ncbi:MAG: hypothetical protein NTU89_04405 [Candidatus Dependentiae bacterium]|nr:hypothetical protein [Candidatus Dependentiae bacterium]
MKHPNLLSKFFLVFMLSAYSGSVFSMDDVLGSADKGLEEGLEGTSGRLEGETDADFETRMQDVADDAGEASGEAEKALSAEEKELKNLRGKSDSELTDAERARKAQLEKDANVDKAKIRKSEELDRDAAQKSAKAREVKAGNTKLGKFKNFVGSGLKGLGGFLAHAGETVVSAVLFMIPNIFQSTILAQKARMVELQTLAAPLKFGEWVLQIPDSCINLGTPTSSFPIYVRVPVDTVGEPVTMFGCTGPSSSNPISSSINTVGEGMMTVFTLGTMSTSLGSLGSGNVGRYNFTPDFYKKSGFVVAAAGSYGSPAASTLTSSQFAGLVVDLNTGYVMDASGEQNSVWPLINLTVPGTDPHGNPYSGTPVSVKDFLPLELSKLTLSGAKRTFTQYQDVSAGSSGNNVSSSIQNQFKCSCIDKGGANADSASVCSSGQCMIRKALDAYASGLFLNSSGRAAMEVPGSTQVNGLGSVVPMFGWGEECPVNSVVFPNSKPVSAEQYSLIKFLPQLQSAFWDADSSKAVGKKAPKVAKQAVSEIMYADPTYNYGAQGCWVYLCANTPFAKALQMQEGGGKKSVAESITGPLVDYIIFLDYTGSNVVPLTVPILAPIAPGSTVMWPTIGLNPAAVYWVSLIGSGLSEFQQNGGPIMYSLSDGGANEMPGGAATISAVMAELISYVNPNQVKITTFPLLSQQFAIHSQALLSKYSYGPFKYGNLALTQSSYNISIPAPSSGGAASTISLYEGSKCFASSVPDLLIPLDSSGSPVSLPDAEIANFLSVITDVSYTVLPDGSVKASDFSQAPINKTGSIYKLNQSEKSTFTTISELIPSSSTAAVADVLAYATTQRDAWFNNFENSSQAQGFNLGALAFKLASGLVTKQAVANNCFIYEVMPSPSAAITNQDYYVITGPTVATLEALKPMSATSASSSSNVVSLVTGLVYDMQGNPVLDSNKNPLKLKSSTATSSNQVMGLVIFDYMVSKFPVGKAMSQEFKTDYLNCVTSYGAQMLRPMGPYSFGSLSISIYAGDLANGNYVYFPSAGMHQKDYEPADMFVTIDMTASPLAFAEKFDGSTTHLLSLVSGQLYDSTGPISILPQSALIAETKKLSANWGHRLQATITRLQAASVARLNAEASEQADLEAAYAKTSSSKVTLSPSDVTTIIKRLSPSGTNGLPYPYDDLKYDSLKQQYVRFSPASPTDASAMLYQFFDVQNSYEVDGKPVQLGAVFDGTGKQLRVVQGVEHVATLDQYGIVGAGTSAQSLGVPLLKPSLLMDEKDLALVPGQSGTSMIVSTDKDFPGKAITLAKGYHLYFSKIMGVYYAFEAKRKQWISIEGGNLYEQDGTPVKIKNKVAKVSGKKGEDDMILLYENEAGYTQGYIDGIGYKNEDNTTGSMSWMATSAPYGSATVVENKNKTSYTLDKKTYSVNSSYVWNPMIFIPIDDTGNILSTMPDSSYNDAQLILNKGEISHMVFDRTMYKKFDAPAGTIATAPGKTTISMVPVDGKVDAPIEVAMGVDAATKAPFVTVIDGDATYKYGFLFDELDGDTQKAYQASVFKGTIVVCPIAFPVGPMTENSVKVGEKTAKVSVPDQSTYAIFTKNISNIHALKSVSTAVNAPDSGTPEGSAFGSHLFRLLSSADGRYFATMYPVETPANASHAPAVTYFNQSGYADLQTGALFDETGAAVGYSLDLKDWLDLLNTVHVCVVQDDKGNNQLVYRNAQAVSAQAKALVADSQAAVAGSNNL